jgi:uncharacterized repeat protein (TIGR02543 family)
MKKRDSVNKKLLYVGAICSLVSLFTTCELPGPEPEPVTVSYEKAVAHIQIESGIPGRTVRPNATLEDVSAWKLLGGKLGEGADTLLEFDVVADATIALEPGEWSFTIKGYKDSDYILSGSIAAQTISLEGTQTLAFEVEPVESGEGTVNLVINLPAGSGITEARVFKDGTAHGSPIPPVGDTIALTETSDAGAYYYSFKLYNGDKLLGVVSEMVHVGANLTSAKTYNLLQKDLNLTYTISYHVPDDTMPVPDDHYQIVAAVTLATPSSRDGYYFKGWYELPEDAAEDALSGSAVTQIPVGSTGNKDFYAKWIPETLSGYSLEKALGMISANPETGEAYTITLDANEPFAPTGLSYGGKKVDITLEGGAEERTLSLSSDGHIFNVGSGVTLTLGNNITIQGRTSNQMALVAVNGGTLEMKAGSKITGNKSVFSWFGSGVRLNSGSFIMNGGEISDNISANYGGGVYINYGAVFIMNDGAISGNTANRGGGVFAENNGRFEMNGGKISGNKAGYGGGVYVNGNRLLKASGGVIYGSDAEPALKNTATSGYSYGHAVYVAATKKRDFTVAEGVILDNANSATWVESLPSTLPLTDSLAWLSASAVEGGEYTITLTGDAPLAPTTLSYSGKTVSITLAGDTEERTLSLSSTGSLFTLEDGVTLKLGANITLQGRSDNSASLVKVNSGATLEMNAGSKIRGNTSSTNGGGVFVDGGAFFMNGGDISGNNATNGGGVFVESGAFTKASGGVIYGADAEPALQNAATDGDTYGHAVYVSTAMKRDSTAAEGVTLDSAQSGPTGGWE